jgi:hypothetical protein
VSNPLVHSLANKEDFAGVWSLPLVVGRSLRKAVVVPKSFVIPTIGVPDV